MEPFDFVQKSKKFAKNSKKMYVVEPLLAAQKSILKKFIILIVDWITFGLLLKFTSATKLFFCNKSETSFNIRLNNHRKDSKNKNPILACKHFQNSNHNFQRDAKFTLIEQITKSFTTTEQLRLLLKKRENFWILTKNTLPRWFESRT